MCGLNNTDNKLDLKFQFGLKYKYDTDSYSHI